MADKKKNPDRAKRAGPGTKFTSENIYDYLPYAHQRIPEGRHERCKEDLRSIAYGTVDNLRDTAFYLLKSKDTPARQKALLLLIETYHASLAHLL